MVPRKNVPVLHQWVAACPTTWHTCCVAEVPELPGEDEVVRAAAKHFLDTYSSKTALLYALHLKDWVKFCQGRNVSTLAAQPNDLVDWQQQARNDGLKDSSIATKLTAVRGFYRSCFQAGLIASDPAVHVDRPHIEYAVKTDRLELDELVRMIDAADAESPTSHALICLLGLCGLRSGETVGLSIEDFEWRSDGTAEVHMRGRRTGPTSSSISIGRRTTRACREAVGTRHVGPLLLGLDGEKISQGSVRRTLHRLAKAAGVEPERVTTQTLRMTYFYAARQANVSDTHIAASMGFRSRAMLEYYDGDRIDRK